jgi:hypothetical protein
MSCATRSFETRLLLPLLVHGLCNPCLQGRLAVLDVGRRSPLHAMLLHEGSQLLRTVYEEDLGSSLADLLYLEPHSAAPGGPTEQREHWQQQQQQQLEHRQQKQPGEQLDMQKWRQERRAVSSSRRRRGAQPAVSGGHHQHVYVSW